MKALIGNVANIAVDGKRKIEMEGIRTCEQEREFSRNHSFSR
jgi:hypothetical protein